MKKHGEPTKQYIWGVKKVWYAFRRHAEFDCSRSRIQVCWQKGYTADQAGEMLAKFANAEEIGDMDEFKFSFFGETIPTEL